MHSGLSLEARRKLVNGFKERLVSPDGQTEKSMETLGMARRASRNVLKYRRSAGSVDDGAS